MKTLFEFNKKRYESYQRDENSMKPRPNGIECPECKEELWDSATMCTITSKPPLENVYCPKCGYRGYRLA